MHIDQILSRAKLEAAIKNLERELSKNQIEIFDKPKYEFIMIHIMFMILFAIIFLMLGMTIQMYLFPPLTYKENEWFLEKYRFLFDNKYKNH